MRLGARMHAETCQLLLDFADFFDQFLWRFGVGIVHKSLKQLMGQALLELVPLGSVVPGHLGSQTTELRDVCGEVGLLFESTQGTSGCARGVRVAESQSRMARRAAMSRRSILVVRTYG